MVEVICRTVAKFSMVKSSGTRTEPWRATRAMSFRKRSTIIRFSAQSFAEARKSAAVWLSGAVPFIGRVMISAVAGFHAKNNSGETEAICHSPKSRKNA